METPTPNPVCPACNAEQIVKNGHIHHSNKQRYLCKACGRQFVENPQQILVSPETRELVDKLLLERIPLAGIARVAEVSETWLQGYVNQMYEDVAKEVKVKKRQRSSKH